MAYFVQQTFLLSLVCVGLSLEDPNTTIFGPPFVSSFFRELKQSFSLTHSANINYIPISQITNDEIGAHLGAGDPVLVNSLAVVDNSSIVIPMFGFSLAIVHSYPQFSVNFTQSALMGIFTGKIRWWNDTELASVNSGLTGPISAVFTGSLLNRFLEAMNVILNRTVNPFEVLNYTTYVAEFVCANVRATPNSIGFAWLGAALEEGSQLGRVMNKDGNFVLPTVGVASAMNEFFLAQKYAPDKFRTPHNMPGRYSYPLVGLLYIVLPSNFDECARLVEVQNFVSLVMFQTSSMDLFAQALGWEPVKSADTSPHTLGRVSASLDYHDILFSLDCGNKQQTNYHTLGTSSQLAVSILKALVPYTAKKYANIRLLSADAGVKVYLDAMVSRSASDLIDMAFIWAPLLKDYQKLLRVPVYMGGVVVFANLLGLNVVLDRSTLEDIFTNNITMWNHTRIQDLNPGIILPSQKIFVLAAADDSIDEGATAAFSRWLRNGSPTFAWSQVKNTLFVPPENDIRRFVGYIPYSIGYGFSQVVANASTQHAAQLVGFDGNPVAFGVDSLGACWLALDHPKCWPLAMPLDMVLPQPTDCAHQQRSVDFVDWLVGQALSIHPFLVPNPDRSDRPLGAAEFCAGRSLLRTIPEPQALTVAVKIAVRVIAGIGICLAIVQAIALGVARKRTELKSASVLFSLLAVIGVFLLLVAPLIIVQDDVSTFSCGTSAWFLCIGYTLCYGSLFAKLFRLYMIFTSRKLVVPRLSNHKLLFMVCAFLVLDVILLIFYSAITPPEPYEFSVRVPSPDDYVTGYRELTLEMCSFHVDSPVLHIILSFKCLVALGGAFMAFFIRQVDRRFTSISALGWAFYNMFLTAVIAIIISVQFDSGTVLETALVVPVFCGFWIAFITLCALALDSNVLLACKDFSRPLRQILNAGKNSRDSPATKTRTTSAEKDQDPDSSTKQSHSSTMFVVNREMFPSKYDDFSPELLDQILQELNHQRAAVRNARWAGSPPSSVPSATTVEIAPVPMADTWRRSSTKVDLTSARLASRSKAGPVPLSVDLSSGTSENSSTANTPRAVELLPEERPVTCSVSAEACGEPKLEN